MSLHPRPWPEVPALTAQVARAAFGPEGALAIRLRDELGAWYEDADFSAAYPVRGKPGISPAQLAVVTVLQFTENLTDRQAADAVRGKLDWKYCLGLELADPGFDFSVLSGFRERLLAGGAERVVFDRLLAQLRELGLVGAGGRQRTDSTHVLGRIRDLNRLELAGEAVRAALEALAAAAPGWLATVIDASWQQVYGQRIDGVRLPEGAAARGELALQYGRDGYYLLEQVSSPGAPGWLKDLPAVQALRLIWIQQYYREDGGKVTRREAGEHGLPPGRARILSPYDPDARYSEKRGQGWTGYKVFLSESLADPAGDDPQTGRPARPQVITSVDTTPAAVADAEMTAAVHRRLQSGGVSPGEHLVDSGFMSGDELTAARLRGITLLGPLLADNSPQARSGGYTIRSFSVDFDRRQATCPQGTASSRWQPGLRSDGLEFINVRFPAQACRQCPDKAKCTTARAGRQLTLRPREVHEAVTAARAAQDTPAFRERYRARAGVEGTIAQATHVTGIRRARYAGLAKTRLEHLIAATAINCIRVDAWYTGKPIDRARTTHLQRLDLIPAHETELGNRVRKLSTCLWEGLSPGLPVRDARGQ
jgi:transposase